MQKKINGTAQNCYDATVTRTGSVTVKAANCEEAFDIVNAMSASEINDKGNLTGWEPSDVEFLGRGE